MDEPEEASTRRRLIPDARVVARSGILQASKHDGRKLGSARIVLATDEDECVEPKSTSAQTDSTHGARVVGPR